MLEGLAPPFGGNLCKVGRLAHELTPEDNEILQSAVIDERWTTSALTLALSERGFSVGETVLRRHRTGKCSCAR